LWYRLPASPGEDAPADARATFSTKSISLQAGATQLSGQAVDSELPGLNRPSRLTLKHEASSTPEQVVANTEAGNRMISKQADMAANRW
jgi:hypothetical protein